MVGLMGRPGRRPGLVKPRTTISIMLPVDVVEQINEISNTMGITRTRWFELVAKEALGEPTLVPERALAWGAELAG